MILETVRLSKSFNALQALDEVDLCVEKGQIFGIAGPNGAGKSTLFNVIAGAFPPSTGRIIFQGRDVTRLKAYQVCRLGLARTFQVPLTFPTLSVYDNLKVGANFSLAGAAARRKKRIKDTLAFLGLSPVQDSLAANLDLYTTKLVMLGATLATGCQLLMLDEPLGGLSPPETHYFIELVRRINQELGITTIIIEHILDLLIEVSNQMLILNNGQVIYDGDPQGVKKSAKVVEVYLGADE